ncbi:uncharacterized protein TNCV_2534561 [Trichonephila clavipes]|nr:uncharacterized protein TNCV_2534561 [Trichonephila clavipes]
MQLKFGIDISFSLPNQVSDKTKIHEFLITESCKSTAGAVRLWQLKVKTDKLCLFVMKLIKSSLIVCSLFNESRLNSSCKSIVDDDRLRQCVVPVRISRKSSRHCWTSPLPDASALIQRYFGCVLGVQQTKQLTQVAKVYLVWQLRCNLGQSLSNHGPHVFYRRKIRRASEPGKQINLMIDEEPLDNACHVWSCIILLKYGCVQALKVRKDNWLQHLGYVK